VMPPKLPPPDRKSSGVTRALLYVEKDILMHGV
jgi:hypothetical protein